MAAQAQDPGYKTTRQPAHSGILDIIGHANGEPTFDRLSRQGSAELLRRAGILLAAVLRRTPERQHQIYMAEFGAMDRRAVAGLLCHGHRVWLHHRNH